MLAPAQAVERQGKQSQRLEIGAVQAAGKLEQLRDTVKFSREQQKMPPMASGAITRLVVGAADL